ncbi:MAG: SDR family NAD(P)-dependent oxidoreductase [Muribaculaceae bacterium]|nr:SDR family NAD(P)-dependent oxidoreductase [Muribaculaceae bacterium]
MNVLIIGATSGIGKSLYCHYAARGCRIAIMGRRKQLLEDMSSNNSPSTIPLSVDISDCASFDNSFKESIEFLGHIDIAIICAGIGELNPSLDITQELETIATNIVGWTNVIDTLYHYFETQDTGHIVSITSVGGLMPTPIAPSYSASKAFQINYTKSLQAKAKKLNFCITEIRPGLVDTRMAKGDGLFWVMPVETVVKQIIRAIENKRKLSIVTKRWRLLNYIAKHLM